MEGQLPPVHDADFQASAEALATLTSGAANHNLPPVSHIHQAATRDEAHTWLARVLPQSTLANLETRFHMGNYVIDRVTGERTFEAMSIYVRVGMHFLYYGSQEEKLLHWEKTLALLKDESEKMGREYDSPQSKDHIIPFIESFNLQDTLAELKEPDPAKYATFNEFFGREIRQSARPVAEPGNLFATSSPADCRLTAFPSVDLATKYWIKGFGFTVARLCGDADLGKFFDGGSMVIARLAPQDYHRWHSPIDGVVERVVEIPGAYYTVNPQAINEPGTMDVFCENRRSVMVLKHSTTDIPILVIAVGAMLVGSIKYNPGIAQAGTEVQRGQCLGAFYYGGSTVIVLYPKDTVKLDEDLVKNSTEQQCETMMRVGWRTGIITQ